MSSYKNNDDIIDVEVVSDDKQTSSTNKNGSPHIIINQKNNSYENYSQEKQNLNNPFEWNINIKKNSLLSKEKMFFLVLFSPFIIIFLIFIIFIFLIGAVFFIPKLMKAFSKAPKSSGINQLAMLALLTHIFKSKRQ